MTLRDLLPWAFWLLTAVALMWDMLVAARTTRVRQAPRAYRSLTSLAGLLVVPGLVVAIAASSNLTGRAIHAVSWIWPLALLVCAAQAWFVVVRRLISPLIASFLSSRFSSIVESNRSFAAPKTVSTASLAL